MIQLIDTNDSSEPKDDIQADKLKMTQDTELKEVFEFCKDDKDEVIKEIWGELLKWRNEAYRGYSMIAKLVMTWKSTKEFLRTSLKKVAMDGYTTQNGHRLEFDGTFKKLLRYAKTGVDKDDPVLKEKVIIKKIVQRSSEDGLGRRVNYGVLECGHEIVINGVDLKRGDEVKCPACELIKKSADLERETVNAEDTTKSEGEGGTGSVL